MSRIESLSVLLDPTGKDYLAELYGKVIENVQKSAISGALKNMNLSGNPLSGTVEAKRMAFAKSKPYGTARQAGKGDEMKAKPVTVALDCDREIVEELEEKDTTLYGVEGLVQRRTNELQSAMALELEKAFFARAAADATSVTVTETDPMERLQKTQKQREKNALIGNSAINL